MFEHFPLRSIFIGLACTLPLIILAALRRRREQKGLEKQNGPEDGLSNAGQSLRDSPNDRFFRELKPGAEVIPLVRIYEPSHKYIIQSILDSRGIPSYLSSRFVNDLLPGFQIKGHTDSVISIAKEDVVAATVFVLEFIDSLEEKNEEAEKSGASGQTIAPTIAFLGGIPMADNDFYPEFLIDLEALADELEAFAGTLEDG